MRAAVTVIGKASGRATKTRPATANLPLFRAAGVVVPRTGAAVSTASVARWFHSLRQELLQEEEDDEEEEEDHEDPRLTAVGSANPQEPTARLPLPTKHCTTCSCDTSTPSGAAGAPRPAPSHTPSPSSVSLCATPLHDPMEPLPPPTPEPSYSVRRRIIPSCCTPLNSPEGRDYLIDSLRQNTASSYLTLTEHSLNQSDPAYCGITTLLMVLNALAVDPMTRWKGGWRYYGSEDMLLQTCHGCLDPVRIQREGITLSEFQRLAQCQGCFVEMKQPMVAEGDSEAFRGQGTEGSGGWHAYGVDEFRKDIVELLSDQSTRSDGKEINGEEGEEESLPGILVVSFGRSALQQTGDGHFSPIAAYHTETDQVLVMDVARFKYQHYWVKVDTLYEAMKLLDKKTQQPRGWFKMYAPHCPVSSSQKRHGVKDQPRRSHYYHLDSEDRRDVAMVPLAGQGHPCPVHEIKVDYCQSRALTEPISTRSSD